MIGKILKYRVVCFVYCKVLKYRMMYFIYRIEMWIWRHLKDLILGLMQHLSRLQDKILAIQKDIMDYFEKG